MDRGTNVQHVDSSQIADLGSLRVLVSVPRASSYFRDIRRADVALRQSHMSALTSLKGQAAFERALVAFKVKSLALQGGKGWNVTQTLSERPTKAEFSLRMNA